MKITIGRLDLIGKMQDEIRKRDTAFKQAKADRDAKFKADFDAAIQEAEAKLARVKKNGHARCDGSITVNLPYRGRGYQSDANTAKLEAGVRILKMCTDELIVLDTTRDKFGLADSIAELFNL